MKKHKKSFKDLPGDSKWTLFLDRDGVINKQIIGGYVLNNSQFEFLPQVPEALAILKNHFKRIFIVSNQQAVGKGLLSMEDLNLIHQRMLEEIMAAGGQIDHIFVAPHLESENNPYRKPGTGMAIEASSSYPDISLSKSIMAGDSESDMIFGRNAGMKNTLINKQLKISKKLFDFQFSSLMDFAEQIQADFSE